MLSSNRLILLCSLGFWECGDLTPHSQKPKEQRSIRRGNLAPTLGVGTRGEENRLRPNNAPFPPEAFRDFRPFPLLGNPHVQTVLGSLLSGPALTFPTRERYVLLDDGDRLALHDSVPARWV